MSFKTALSFEQVIDDNYLHNIIGMNDQGDICQLVETGKL
jgi:hypothetical protein